MLLTLQPRVQFSAFPKDYFIDTEIYRWPWLEEIGHRLDIIDQTRLVLVSKYYIKLFRLLENYLNFKSNGCCTATEFAHIKIQRPRVRIRPVLDSFFSSSPFFLYRSPYTSGVSIKKTSLGGESIAFLLLAGSVCISCLPEMLRSMDLT